MPIAKPPKEIEAELNRRIDEVRAEFADEEREAAEEEVRERDERDAASSVFSVRLSRPMYDAVREAAERAHLTPSALIRQWVSERVSTGDEPGDLSNAVAALRLDVERLAKLAKSA